MNEDGYELMRRLAKSLQAQVEMLEKTMWAIAVQEIPDTNDEEHDMLHDTIAEAQDTLRRLKLHRES